MGKQRAAAHQTEMSLQFSRNPQWEELTPAMRQRLVELVAQLLIVAHKMCSKNVEQERSHGHGQDHTTASE